MESNRLARNLKRAHIQIQNFKDPEIVFSFPLDIITEIFARLPVKSLLRFRCGSKSWCCLISSKSFVKKHLDYSTKNTNLTNHCVIATYTRPHHSLTQYSLSSLLYEPSSDAVDNEYPVSDSNRNVCVVGCCNGLVCIKSSKDLILWNLSTREFKKLPEISCVRRMPLFDLGTTIIVYDLKHKVLKRSLVTNSDLFLDAYVCVQSLVSFS